MSTPIPQQPPDPRIAASLKVSNLAALVGHLITFEVYTPHSSSGDLYQVPVLLLQELRKSQGGDLVLTGLDTKKIFEAEKVTDAFRSYRVDRIRSRVVDLGTVESRFTLPTPDEDGYIHL